MVSTQRSKVKVTEYNSDSHTGFNQKSKVKVTNYSDKAIQGPARCQRPRSQTVMVTNHTGSSQRTKPYRVQPEVKVTDCNSDKAIWCPARGQGSRVKVTDCNSDKAYTGSVRSKVKVTYCNSDKAIHRTGHHQSLQ